jgi:transglutaminase-like putative cysteine protease
MSDPGAEGAAHPGGGELLVHHETLYTYSSQVAFAQHLGYLRPMTAPGQEVDEFAIEIDPPASRLKEDRDVFGNHRIYFALNGPHEELRVRARSRVRLQPRFERLDVDASPPWEVARSELRYVAGAPFLEASEFCFASPRVPREPELREYAQPSFAPGRSVLAGAFDLMHRIHREFRYDVSSTDVTTTVSESFAVRAGVCQDFSHVMIACLRSLGLAARYVSGYLHTRARFADTPARMRAPAATPGEPAVVGADASHAWVSVFCPRLGWVEFDPTNDAIPGMGHVRLAYGRDYGDVAPLRGVVQGGGEHVLRVAVGITAVAG